MSDQSTPKVLRPPIPDEFRDTHTPEASRHPSDTLPLSRESQAEKLLGVTLGGRYKLLSVLGSGAMGDVYLAQHVDLKKPMAVKVLRQSRSHDEGLLRRFQQEAIAVSRIGHENIVNVTDFGRTANGLAYFVMEALDGGNLFQWVKRNGAMELRRTLSILLQVSKALSAAHAQGIVHRDLKLANLVLVEREDGSDLVKVLDFGMSKVTARNDIDQPTPISDVGQIIGTPSYMSPEQIRGEAADHRTDIYALGVIAHELATGALPFFDTTAEAVMMMHINEPPKAPGRRWPQLNLPEDFDRLVLRALEKDRAHRYQSMDEFRDALIDCLQALDLQAILSTEPEPALEKTLPSRAAFGAAEPRPSMGPMTKLVLALLSLVVVVGAVVLGVRLTQPAKVIVLPTAAPAQTPSPLPQAHPAAVAAPEPKAPVVPVAAVDPGGIVLAPSRPPLPARLEAQEVAKVFSRSSPKLRKCLQDNRPRLAKDSGRLEFRFTILASGAVSEAKMTGEMDETVTQCVMALVKQLRFPKHVEAQQTFELPLEYAFK